MKVVSILPLLCLRLVAEGLAAPPSAQQPLQIAYGDDADRGVYTEARRKLHGRFLHITDMHPDPHYRVGSSEKKACHRGKPKAGKPSAGYFGLSYSDCDSPFSLTNYTLDYLSREWADEIDFVIWTGDSARHDSDRKRPRTTAEIYGLNRVIAKKMEEVFGRRGIPVVPSIGGSFTGAVRISVNPNLGHGELLVGNNDCWTAHNIMMPGPNSITSEYSSIWRSFVPFPAYQVFQRGGYFSVEVIPNSLAVISLNTMYFYDSNAAVGGCKYSDPQDPGNLQFDWLEVQLQMFRERNMQVWLSGHVPPSSRNYFPECYVRYVELSLRFQDTIVGHLFGHMNMDHFFLLDAEQLAHRPNVSMTSEHEVTILKSKKKELYQSLVQAFSVLPKAENMDLDNFGIVNVAPSLIPTYLPSFRIFVYNTTGKHYEAGRAERQEGGHRRRSHSMKDVVGPLCDDMEYANTWRCKLTQVWHSNAHSPSRRNMLWTPLGYAQYFMPDLDEAKEGDSPKYKLEYTTLPVHTLHPDSSGETRAGVGEDTEDAEWNDGGGDDGDGDDGTRHTAGAAKKAEWPIPRRHLPRSLRNSTVSRSKRYAPYGLEDLTVGAWTRLAGELGHAGGKKLRQRFKELMYMGGAEA
ncbi:uncharacterized protein BXZ73DRAFT_97450 [Epithele typhae]|uniref:uncharacterized protein n=1 Tax=Epithele typhae TaxID=378194 RepID=UPI002008DC9D|nr:uncharacterized protein BXZ73DRAFT_97450 [Epithele typhae]KAH9943409.1 hypothetical protein BXZ73DRAFT_97450 [Epithele typhae]